MTDEELDALLALVSEADDGDSEPLRALARAVGSALPNNDLEQLDSAARRFRSLGQVSGLSKSMALTVLSTTATSYMNEITARHRRVDVAMLAERTSLMDVLLALDADEPRRPMVLAEEAGVSRTAITRRLTELRELGLARVEDDRDPDGRARVYFLTPSGEDVARIVKKRRSMSQLTPQAPPATAVVRRKVQLNVNAVMTRTINHPGSLSHSASRVGAVASV